MGGAGNLPAGGGGTRVGRHPRQDAGPRGNGSRRGPTGLCPSVEEEDGEGRNPQPGQGLPGAAGPPRVTLARPRRAGGGEASAQPRPPCPAGGGAPGPPGRPAGATGLRRPWSPCRPQAGDPGSCGQPIPPSPAAAGEPAAPVPPSRLVGGAHGGLRRVPPPPWHW